MSKKDNKFYITTPIYYTSGKPHLGHAYTTVACDVIARWNRSVGKEVFFLTGTDEHGQKVERKANEVGKSPKEYVDSLIPEFTNLLQKLNVSNDFFIRTTDNYHKKFVQKVLQISYDKGDIYKASYEGLYCVECEQYYKDEELNEGNICPIHKKKVDVACEENYFFKLSAYQEKILRFYNENPEFLSPKSRASEIINRVKEGLVDISISRHKNTLTWGIELPFDSDHVAYVWFDALFNYISALDENKKHDFWPSDVHVVGKDIMWFHTVIWPALLMSTDYELPKKVFSHGWWTVNGEKMGKSLGNVIEPIELCEKYGTDEFRFYIMSSGTFGEDQNFLMGQFADKINNDLNNDLGNLVSRVHAMTGKYFAGSVPKERNLGEHEIALIEKSSIFSQFNTHMQNLEINKAVDVLWNFIRETNAYINKVEPWKEKDIARLETIINTLVSSVKIIAGYLECIMPNSAEKIRKQFNFEKGDFKKFENVKAGHKLNEKENLFQKIKLEDSDKIEDQKGEKGDIGSEKNRTGFSKLNLKVGKIIEIEGHPEADKLFVEKIDIGEDTPRQIVSGLKEHYKPEELLNKKVIVVANLKPAKLRGVRSEGMILAAENKEGEVGVITTDAPIGSILEIDSEKADNPSRITVDDFFEIKIVSEGTKIILDEKEITVENKSLRADKEITGSVR